MAGRMHKTIDGGIAKHIEDGGIREIKDTFDGANSVCFDEPIEGWSIGRQSAQLTEPRRPAAPSW